MATTKTETTDLGLIRRLSGVTFGDALPRVTEALAGQGFGVLTEINVKQTFKKKLNQDFPNYVILGACNPPIAFQALSADRMMGLLMPCNVVVAELDNGDVEVSAINTMRLFTLVDDPRVEPLATEVNDRLFAALESL